MNEQSAMVLLREMSKKRARVVRASIDEKLERALLSAAADRPEDAMVLVVFTFENGGSLTTTVGPRGEDGFGMARYSGVPEALIRRMAVPAKKGWLWAVLIDCDAFAADVVQIAVGVAGSGGDA